MRRRLALIGLGVAVLLGLAIVGLLAAEGLLYDSRPQYDDAWAECAGDDVCVAIPIPCDWTAVNGRHREAAEAYYGYLATVIDLRCRADEVPTTPPAATCRAGRCVLE